MVPSADQVPNNSAHSAMRGGKWVVLIAGSTGRNWPASFDHLVSNAAEPGRHGGLIYIIDSYPNDGSCGFMQAITNDTTRAGFFPATAKPDPDWWQALWPQPSKFSPH